MLVCNVYMIAQIQMTTSQERGCFRLWQWIRLGFGGCCGWYALRCQTSQRNIL